MKERLRLNIELADNGIIIRNRDFEDEITLAIEKEIRVGDVQINIDHSEEHKKIGRKIYNWLIDEVLQEHCDELIITNFDLDITATCKGREITE